MIVDHDGHQDGDAFVHSALIAGTDDDLSTSLIPELHRAAAICDEVLLVVSEHTRKLLADQLPDRTGSLRWADPAMFYQRLGFAYEGFRRYLSQQAQSQRRVQVVAEPDLIERTDTALRPTRVAAYLAYEAACNDAYAPYPSAVTCLWDSRRHPDVVLRGVRRTHPRLLTPAGSQPNLEYQPPQQYLTNWSRTPLSPAPPHVDHDRTLTEVAELSDLRATLTAWATRHGFADEPTDDLIVAVTETASNALRHAATAVRVRAWRRDSTLVVQCDDTAGLPVPAVAGFHHPNTTGAAPGGRGLWLARQLADIALINTVAGRTSIRLYFPHAVLHSA
ncbi:sensor histidine kinase [Actinoplanes sp. DH11]|uniref:sensor histidine kinase n=1 Tax=Actinoplanes sp. DH11 TaxID=2857011 RepID=UPI001E34B9C9|nr:sensor histidine kinase [Actinoplanes sp. DH11]